MAQVPRPRRRRPTEPKGKTKRATGEPRAKRPSGLDAAAAVLAEVGTPLNTKEMVERMLATGMWQTGGKTPAATIYAAIIREVTFHPSATLACKNK